MAGDDLALRWRNVLGRRSFLHGIGVAGAAALPGTALFAGTKKLSEGDAAILKFLAAAELIESDLWSQYNDLGGINGGNMAFKAALANIDGDMSQYITDNTDDELSHAAFINAYLMSKGEDPVSLDGFRKLPGSAATGANPSNVPGRLTELRFLNVDTSYYFRYRSTQNPDLGAMFPQLLNMMNQPTIPISDTDTDPNTAAINFPINPGSPPTSEQLRMQAIANSAAFHFGMIEQGGSSLYPTLAQQVTSVEVLRILLSIGGVEIDHFSLWHDKLGNTISPPLAPANGVTNPNAFVTDPKTKLTFPNFDDPANQHNSGLSAADQTNDATETAGVRMFQHNLILAEPCSFLNFNVPCSVIRPTSTANSGAVAAVKGLTASNLFANQSQGFFSAVMALAVAADQARRDGKD
ncbi:MAG TPA: hypothetical protein VEU11_06150 [Terriglobales bacterium]|nr:hypothetical protein [Terriglobales bacterium]